MEDLKRMSATPQPFIVKSMTEERREKKSYTLLAPNTLVYNDHIISFHLFIWLYFGYFRV
jgi:hypothetical protein